MRAAILHEPVMTSLTDDPAAVRGAAATLVKEGMESGGPPAALERFWRLVSGETGWDDVETRLRERMLASADTFFGVEVGTFETFLPDDDTLAAITVPVQVLISDEGRRPSHEAAGRLAERLGVDLTRTPGTHTPYHHHPNELAQTMRSFLHRVSEVKV